MAITVNWTTKVVFIPEADPSVLSATVTPGLHYEYDLDLLRLEIKAIEASEEGMPFDDIHLHTTAFTIGNITLARVIAIINGYTLEFEDGQYQVDLNGANSDIHLNRVLNQVSLNTANTAGLVTTEGIITQISSAVWETLGLDHVLQGTMGFVLNQITYQNKIWIDPLNTTGNAVTGIIPGVNGTPGAPCLNPADAKVIGGLMNITTLKVLSATTLDRDFPRWEFEGTRDVLLNPAGFDITSAEFRGLCLAGNFAGYKIAADGSAIGDDQGSLMATNLYGDFVYCALNAIGSSLAAGETIFADCHSTVAGPGRPTVDFQGIAGVHFSLRNYSGGFEPLNMSNADNIATIGFTDGKLTVGATCTTGTIEARGTAGLNDSANGGTVISVIDLVNTDLIANSVWDEILASHAISGSTGEALATSASSNTPKVEIKQAWTRAITGGSKMRALASLHLDGQIVILPGTATLDVIVRDSAGTALISQTGITANAEGYFSLTEDPYSPSAGVNLASFATITNGGDVYTDLTPISFPEFA